MARSELKPGGARIIVQWGYDSHDVVLTPRNWTRVKRGKALRIRSPGFSEEGFQWEYWNFAGGLDGDLVVEYGDDGGTGFIGKLDDATIEEMPETATVVQRS
jgi:hypothetical protein